MIALILISLLVGAGVVYFIRKRDDKIEKWPDQIYEIFNNTDLTTEERNRQVDNLLK